MKTSQLQEGITVNGNKITGTLHYVKGFTGFSGLSEEQEGHFLVMQYVPDPYEPDLTMCSRITDKEKQKLEVYAELNGVKSETTVYDISGLTLEPDESEEDLDG